MLPPQVKLDSFDLYGFKCHGLFAQEDLDANTVVWIWDRATEPLVTFTRKEIMDHPEREKLVNFSYMVNDDCFASTTEPEADPCWYFNHSCDPNCWFEGDDKIVTRRPVLKGEQLCYDYACTETESSLHYGMECRCGAATCRGQLKFTDWRSRGFIKKNLGHVTDYIMRKHAENGWYDTRMELRYKSKTSMGLFCREESDCKILKGDIVLMFSGKIIHKDHLLERNAMTPRDFEMSLQVHRDLWQIPAWKETGDKCETSDYINHSCDPSCGMLDSVTVVAIRDLYPGEEITIDYCMVNDGSNDQPSDNFTCMCGSVNCRTTITTLDWQIPELQTRLGQYFAPFVKRLIDDTPFSDVKILHYWSSKWFVRVKDRKRLVPALIANERTGVATSNVIDKFRDHPHGIVWIHGASVGECLSALPLIKFLTHESGQPTTLPTYNVLLTTTTPSARQLLNQRLQSNPTAMCIFAPLDHVTCVNRFLDTWCPSAAIWIESEIWPNLIAETASRQVPMAILNGRMSIQSFDRWNSWFLRRFAQFLLSQFRLVLCQSPEDLRRFQSLGQADAKYLGDLKFVADKATIDPADLLQLQNAIGSRVLWVAASTHEGEEDIVLATHVQLLSSHPDALLVLIPRHPHRVPAIIRELSAQYPHLKTTTRTQDQVPSADSNVFIVDTMGETQLYYEAASVVFVGGSLVPIGGHNILEPLRSGCTVLHGPHMTNFTSVVQTLQSPDVVQVSSSSLLSTLRTSLDSPSRPFATGNQSLAPIQDALWANVTRFLTG
ncbi:hypothetical protein LEN26_015779 [Aphanomyces euteiches]|nr:hypothetical protein LEN26_015779 [Aphanomyces euteiches]